MSNNGLYFSQVRLRVDFGNRCYLLRLLCQDKDLPQTERYLALKKVGPDVFFRLRNSHWNDIFRLNQGLDGYIITAPLPETSTFIEDSNVQSVQLCSLWCSKEVFYNSILEISPLNTWDASRFTFLKCDDYHFSGYVKFSGSIFRESLAGSTDLAWDDIYLAWAGLFIPSSARDAKGRESIWVRMYLAGEWESRPNPRYGNPTDTGRDALERLEWDSIQWGSGRIVATVVTRGDPGKEYFRIYLNAITG
jgi:hypothetical protein